MVSEELMLLHTNDIHSHLENWPKVRHFIQSQQNQARRQGHQTFVFDIGDAIDRQHALTEATLGQANVKLMNEIGYTAATVGNNEMLGLDHEALNHLYDEANYPILVSNILDASTHQRPEWADDYKIVTTKAGQKIALFGLTAPFERTLPLLGWEPVDIDVTLERLLPELQAQADTIILLSHLGLPTDRDLADRYPALDLIMGAHTHHVLPDGEWHGDTLVAAAGRYGSHVGTVQMTLENGKMTSAHAKAWPTETMPELPEDAEEKEHFAKLGNQKLTQRVIADMPTIYSRKLTDEHRLIDLGLTSLQNFYEADVAVLSSGMFLTDLPAGPVTQKDLHDCLPHAVHPMLTKLTGHELQRLLLEIQKNRNFLLSYQVKGMGFRGHQAFGEMVWAGLAQDADGNWWVNHRPLDPYQTYTIAGLDHYLFIPFFPTIEIAGINQMNYDVLLREVVAATLTKKFN